LSLNSNTQLAVIEVEDLGVVVDTILHFTLILKRLLPTFICSNLILKCFVLRDIETLIQAFAVYDPFILEYDFRASGLEIQSRDPEIRDPGPFSKPEIPELTSAIPGLRD